MILRPSSGGNMDWQFYLGLGILFMLGLTIISIIRGQKRFSKATDRSSQYAKKVASSLWYVEGVPQISDEGVRVVFRHFSFNNRKFCLPVRVGHPDIEMFRILMDGDTVEFEALPERTEGTLKFEVCGYLRIKSVS